MMKTSANQSHRSRSPQRRGSFLVAVVAILSLLAVLTIVYVTVGRTDAQLSAAVQRKSERGQPELVFRDYILGILAEDVNEAVDPSEQPDVDLQQPLIQEAWDYPSTPWNITFYNPLSGNMEQRPVTVGGDEDDVAYFTPSGVVIIRDGMDEYRVGTGTDPWLSSTEPTWLDWNGDSLTTPGDYPTRRVDLSNISNVAPDGAFVNLFNLRDTVAGFNATPWEMRGATGIGAMLTLYSPENDVDGTGTRGTDTDFNYVIGGGGFDDLSFQAETRPYFWTSRQIGAHRPVGDPHYGPGDALYSPYQWADADGDGAFDARWFELVIDRDPGDETWNEIFSRQGDLRYFAAVTIRDLSALVNVNTATDGTLGPAGVEPDGITPAHIDLRRLLTLLDPARDAGPTGAAMGSYDALSNPITSDYANYDPDNAYEIGDRAYDALRFAINNATMPGVLAGGGANNPGYQGLELAAGDPNDVNREFYYDDPTKIAMPRYNNIGRAGHYLRVASIDPTTSSVWDRNLGTPQYTTSPLFGLESLEELLAFRRLNDYRSTSRLELAMHGRGNFPANDDVAGFGPLRSDRVNESAYFYDDMAGDPAGRTNQFLAHSLLDVRGRLTTLSGHRPIYAADLVVPTAFQTPAQRATATQITPTKLRRTLDRALLTDADALFRLYADALLPWSDRPGAWTDAEEATLAYANDPERAIRIAAHMAVNMVDIADNDNIPTRRTLLVDFSRRGDFVTGQDGNGIPTDVEPALPHRVLELPEARLAQTDSDLIDGTNGYGRAVRVFGIEAQPFITMAGTMAVYCDVTSANGGNAEPPDIAVPPTGPPGGFIPDIDTDFDVNNQDFLFEVLAVELTNPFDVDIELSGDLTTLGDGAFGYYVQFGDLYFRLADHDHAAPQTSPTALTLAAGDTITAFCMSQTPARVLARLQAAGAVSAMGSMDDWIEAQFGEDAVLMWPMVDTMGNADLVNGTPLDPTSGGLIDILRAGGSGPAAEAERDIVRLWFADRPGLVTGNPAVANSESAIENDPLNDILVDRMRADDPAEAGILSEVRREGGNQEIDGTSATTYGSGDDAGYTIAQWATVRRQDDPDALRFEVGAVDPYFGTLPAWAFASVDDSNLVQSVTAEDNEDTVSDPFDKADFSAPYAASTLDAWFMNSESGTVVILPGINQEASARSGEFIAGINEIRVEHRLTGNNGGTAVSTINIARLADLLLPMGIGPMHDPGDDLTDPADDRWLTLAEALTIASFLDDPAAVITTTDLDLFSKTQMQDHLFYGQLYVDDYVPFYDENANGAYDPPAFGGRDVPWGLRISPAMRIVHAASALPNTEASIVRPIFGTININTAPLETLRMLPMLSPPLGEELEPDLAGEFNSQYGVEQAWWWDNYAGAEGAGQHTVDSDIAATLVAYRDRLRLSTREPDSGLFGPTPLDFLDSGGTLSGDGPPGYDSTDTGRGSAIGFTGTTERPGIRSIGELLAIRDLGGGSELHDIDRLIDDDLDLALPGVAGTLYDANGDGVLESADGIIDSSGNPADDYDEQFAVANSVFNTVSIGSDYYAVWFLLHGYSEEDTTVAANEPLVPTVARRFLMVVDRSNVVRAGDQPKVLLFREVPVALP